MKDISESASTSSIHHDHPRTTSFDEIDNLRTKNKQLLRDLNSLQTSYDSLQLESKSKDENSILLHQQNTHLHDALRKALSERDIIREELKRVELSSRDRQYEFVTKIEGVVRENMELGSELDELRRRIEIMLGEKRDNLKPVNLVNDCMERVSEYLDEFETGHNSSVERESESLAETKINGDGEQESVLISETSMEIKVVTNTANEVERKLNVGRTMRKKAMRELENSVKSLTEENLDLTNLLRVALVEKEAAKKSLYRQKVASEEKGVGILKIAERGLYKVGFGFIMGGGDNEKPSDNSSLKSEDGSECEEEAVSLASTWEGIMKGLRVEVAQLRLSLEESRSDCERLQVLVEKQAQKLSANTLYIKELEDQETLQMQNVNLLSQNIENLLMEIKEAGEEVARWREACELEVEASTKLIQERDRLVAIFKQELEKTKGALNMSNGKLQLKEELAEAAMAAQAAAERSLHVADSRAAQLQQQIEELLTQLEEAEKRERNQRQWARHICWPWRALNLNPPAINSTPPVPK